jgi:hypothetical protein
MKSRFDEKALWWKGTSPLSYSWFQTSQTGGQRYSDTSPFSIPWLIQLNIQPSWTNFFKSYKGFAELPKFYGLHYKHVMIENYASSDVNKLRASLNGDASVVIYDRNMFIVQSTGLEVEISDIWNCMSNQSVCFLFKSGI